MTIRKYFGTDGVRGTANQFPVTPDIIMRLGMAAACHFRKGGQKRNLAVIGKDTRLSGYMIEPALTSGFAAMGMDVVLLGPLPTPGVAMITRSLRADLGVMITASHNKFQDNGVKLFGPDGHKLSDKVELEIEAIMQENFEHKLADPKVLGRVKRIDDSQARYVEIVKSTFPKRLNLNGLRIVIDCANGAAYKVAPTVLYELGAEIFPIGVEPDGFNINDEVGSTATKALSEAVLKYRADIGISLDGDADRLVLCDEMGKIIDGDQILAAIATSWKAKNRLAKPAVVSTIMSNLGLENYLKGLDLKLERTKVGDRYVLELMRKSGYNLGGESSGHIILSDISSTGDGLLAALQILMLCIEQDQPASEICDRFEPVPQALRNIRFNGKDPLKSAQVKMAIDEVNHWMGDKGRLVVRKSGTEPLIRIMAESHESSLVEQALDKLGMVIEEAR